MKLRAFDAARLLICLGCLLATTGLVSDAVAASGPYLRVLGNELVNASGQRVVLHGVDRSGTEYECVQGNGIFDGPSDLASVTAMKQWDINAVRIPLNEACWNGQAYVKAAYRAGRYRAAIRAYVRLLNANGIVAILDLHWSDGLYTGPSSGCASAEAVCQKPMPDAAESIRFWSSVAATFAGNDAVIFDLFNEPYPDRALPTETAAWKCWLHGGPACSPGISYPVAGMQTLVNAVRATGASNVIMVGGLAYANDLSQWLKYEPVDPDHNLVASWHSYSFNACDTQSCWTSQISPVIAKVPVIAGEIGESDCADDYIDPLMAYLDSEFASYLAWSWNAGSSCVGSPRLITSYSGTPTAYGAGYRSHLLSLAGSPDPSATSHGPEASSAATFSDYRCAASGATATSHFRPYGAVANGTVDDTSAIQNAIDAASAAGGGVVTLPVGRFLINGHLVMKSNVKLTGAGPATVIKAGPKFLGSTGPNGGYPVITTAGASNVTIANLTADQSGNVLNGNANPGQRFSAFLVDLRNSHNVVASDVYTRNPFTYSIAVVGSSDFCVAHCNTLVATSGLYNGLDGIHVLDSHTGQVIQNHIDQRVGTDGDDGLVAHTISAPVYDVLYAGNVVRGGNYGDGMQLAVGNYPVYDLAIRNNNFWGSPFGIRTGYYSTGSNGSVHNILISGNYIHDLVPGVAFPGGGNAIDIGDFGAVAPVTHVTVTDNRICGAGVIKVVSGAGNVVADNQFCSRPRVRQSQTRRASVKR